MRLGRRRQVRCEGEEYVEGGVVCIRTDGQFELENTKGIAGRQGIHIIKIMD